MEIFLNLGNYFLDFLFPKSQSVIDLENLSATELINIFPSPRAIDNERVIALFDYQDKQVRDLIWQIKYKKNSKLINSVALIIYEIICTELAERALFENFINPLLVPMPMSQKRKAERGFNQTELICEAIINVDQARLLEYVPNTLLKIKHTESQTKTESKSARLKNLHNSMEVSDKEKLRNQCVVLIDDVYTTGASVTEATRALKEAGVRKILTLTIAH